MNVRLETSVFLSLFLMVSILLAVACYATTQPNITNYYLNTDGSVLVELIFFNVSQRILEVSLEQGFDASTLYAVDSYGVSLPVDLVGDEALVNLMSSVEWVKLTYLISNVTELSDDVVFKFRLSPRGDCTVYVPGDFLLLTYSGSPAIDIVNETLLLEYKGVDSVEITLILLQPATQTTTPPPSQPRTENVSAITIGVSAVIIALILVLVLKHLKGRKP